jgi:hypothetical protein
MAWSSMCSMRALVWASSVRIDLPAGEAPGLQADVLEGHGQQGDGDLLAGGDQHVQFARVGLLVDFLGQAMRRLVSPDMADTTTTTWWPSILNLATRSATLRMRSMEPTEVPPYF